MRRYILSAIGRKTGIHFCRSRSFRIKSQGWPDGKLKADMTEMPRFSVI
jgi:hypothetical protein